MNINLFLLFILLAVCKPLSGFSQLVDSLTWWNPPANVFPVIEGQGWSKEVKEPYNRLPARAEKTVRKPVWALSRNATGLIIRFKTTAETFTVKYTVKGRLDLPHFSATGLSGLDLYSVSRDGRWNWAPGKYKFGEKPGDTISYGYSISKKESGYEKGREYVLYLPIYNTVDWLRIGIPKDAIFEPLSVRAEKPIAIYGTSITQGACASRPGMAWPAIVGRRLDYPMINLGFSGNGTLDKEMLELFGELDAKMFVLDCLGNMMDRNTFPKEEVKRRVIWAVNYLQSKRPGVPILMAEFGAFNIDRLDASRGVAIDEQNEVLKDAFAALQKLGVKNIYLITAKDMNMGMEDTADYGHPNDLGLTHYADAFEKIFRRILSMPKNNVITSIGVSQYRNDVSFDWRERHQQLLKLNRISGPETVFLGSGAVQRWPDGMKEKGTRNFGFEGDRIENMLWRVEHGELDGYKVKRVVLMPGTDNLELNTDAEIISGIRNLLATIKARQPQAEVIFTGLLPESGSEKRIIEINTQLRTAVLPLKIKYIDLGKNLLKKEGKIDSRFYDDDKINTEGYKTLANTLKKIGITL